MRKRRKKMKSSEQLNLAKDDFETRVKKITENLYYISETDAEILPFVGKKAKTTDAKELLNQIECATAPVEEKDFNGFFARLTEIQDWFGDEEKATATKFSDLKKLLEENLKNIKVFKVGSVQLDLYVVGLNAQSNLAGIKTKAVET